LHGGLPGQLVLGQVLDHLQQDPAGREQLIGRDASGADAVGVLGRRLQFLAQRAALGVQVTAHVEQAKREMGDDFWPHGFEKNEATLRTFLRYSFEQGLSKRLLAPRELFAPQTLESFRI
jgi:hypothetical protein